MKGFIQKLILVHTHYKSHGLKSLYDLVIKKIRRKVLGNQLKNHFPIAGRFAFNHGDATNIYAGYRDYIKPLHFVAHTASSHYSFFIKDNLKMILDSHVNSATIFFQYLTKNIGISIEDKTIMDIGSSSGFLPYVLAKYNAKEVHGTDLLDSNSLSPNKRRVTLRQDFLNSNFFTPSNRKAIEKRVRLYHMDIQAPESFPTFDIIISNSVLEHIQDLKAGLTNMAKMIVKDGYMVHQYNPFFSETGGHEYCILDFPWGHVRLTPSELEQYLSTFRGWEAEKALQVFNEYFNQPKMSFHEIDQYIKGLGFKQVYLHKSRTFGWIDETPMQDILKQSRRTYPSITEEDLMFDSIWMAYQKVN